MRALTWLLRALLFLLIFAFALNNQQTVEIHGLMGWRWQAPMVLALLLVFALGCGVGVLAMLPSWWRHRRDARQRQALMPAPVQDSSIRLTGLPVTEDGLGAGGALEGLPYPPDMPAPRKSAK